MSIIKYVKGGFSILRQQGQVARPLKSCLFACPHCVLAWNVLSPPFSKADPPFGLSSSLTPIWNHYWLLDPPPSFWSNVPVFLLSAWVGVPGSSSPSWLYLTWLQGAFCLDLPFTWVFFFFFFAPCLPYPPDSCIGKASHHLTLSLWNTTCLASSKPACLLDSTSDVLASAQNLEICHQAPNPATSFLLKSSPFHLFHPHPTPGFLASWVNFLHPLSAHLNPSCLPTCQLNTLLHGSCSGQKVTHCYQV